MDTCPGLGKYIGKKKLLDVERGGVKQSNNHGKTFMKYFLPQNLQIIISRFEGPDARESKKKKGSRKRGVEKTCSL